MEIAEKDLQYLLESKKHHIKSKETLIQNVICLLGFISSVILSGVFAAPLYIKIIISVIAFFYLGLFTFSVYGSNYSVEALLNDICSCSKVHPFSLVIIKNNKGEYLLKKDNRWKTFLFPFKRTKENDTQDLKDFLQYSLNVSNFEIKDTKETTISKYSVSAKTNKTYQHTFYYVDFDTSVLPAKNKFRINKTVYKWFSLDEIKANKNMISKNRETIDFVEQNF